MGHMFYTSENSPVLVLKYGLFSPKYYIILVFKHLSKIYSELFFVQIMHFRVNSGRG